MKKPLKDKLTVAKIYESTNKRLEIHIAKAVIKGEKITRAELIDRMEKAYKIPS